MNKTKIDWCDYASHTRKSIRIKTGYVWVWCPEHPSANKGKTGKRGYIPEHRLVMSNHVKRMLTADEHVHHINGNKADNRIDNLILVSNSEHRAIHMSELTEAQKRDCTKGLVRYAILRKRERIIVPCACGCGKTLIIPDNNGRDRRYIRGHNTLGMHWRWQKNG